MATWYVGLWHWVSHIGEIVAQIDAASPSVLFGFGCGRDFLTSKYPDRCAFPKAVGPQCATKSV